MKNLICQLVVIGALGALGAEPVWETAAIQAKIDAAIDKYNYNAQRPLTALSNYNQLIQGTYGGTTTSTGKSGYSGSALGSAIGGATAAAGLASALGGQDGLLSYFG